MQHGKGHQHNGCCLRGLPSVVVVADLYEADLILMHTALLAVCRLVNYQGGTQAPHLQPQDHGDTTHRATGAS